MGPRKLMTSASQGLFHQPSHHAVDETVARLKTILQAKGVRLFAEFDHSGEAPKAGMTMRPTKLLIFGNPKAGTPIMVAAPASAIDLPLKFWSGKILKEKFLQAITPRHTYRNVMTCRRSC